MQPLHALKKPCLFHEDNVISVENFLCGIKRPGFAWPSVRSSNACAASAHPGKIAQIREQASKVLMLICATLLLSQRRIQQLAANGMSVLRWLLGYLMRPLIKQDMRYVSPCAGCLDSSREDRPDWHRGLQRTAKAVFCPGQVATQVWKTQCGSGQP